MPEGDDLEQFENSIQPSLPLEGEGHDPKSIEETHRDIIVSSFHDLVQGEGFDSIENLIAYNREGKGPLEHGFFQKGIDLSLWNVNGKLVIVSTSDHVSTIEVLRKTNDARNDALEFEIINGGSMKGSIGVAPRISHNQNQDPGKKLTEWANLSKHGKTKEALNIYHQLIKFAFDGKTPYSKSPWWQTWDIKDPLLYWVTRGMWKYASLNQHQEDNPFVGWILNNADLSVV